MAEIIKFPSHLRKKPEIEPKSLTEPGKFYDINLPADINGELYYKVQCEYQVPNKPNEYSVNGIPRGGRETKAFILRFTPDRGWLPLNQKTKALHPMNKVTNNLILELHVPNFDKARTFYALFGFSQLKYDPTSGVGSDLGYMILKREDAIGETHLNFYGDKEKVSQHPHFRTFTADTPRGYAVEITIPVSDVEGLWWSVKDRLDATQIAQPLKLKRWNKKDFRVVDPFGFYVRFTELVERGQ